FPGQGAQWPAMAQELLRTCAPFRAEIEACAAALEPHVEWSLLDVLEQRPGAASLDRVDVVQPTLFAMMAGLAATWRALGVVPEVVVGHSQGEIGAAYCAGVLSLDDAAMLVARRSQLIRALSGTGGMAAVQLSREELDERSRRIDPSGEELAIAVDNGGTSMVVSGTLGAVDALLAELEADGVFARKVKVDYASHCAQVEPIQAQMLEACATIQPRVGHTPMMSTVDLRLVDGPELDGSYWFRNLRQRVRFGEAVAQLLDSGFSAFVEVSPHPLMGVPLAGAFEARGAGDETLFLPTLRRDQGGLEVLDGRLAELALAGAPIDWSRHFEASGEAPQLPLPTYAFQRRRFWIDRPTRTADAGPAKATDDAAPAADNPLATLAAAALEDGDLDALADELDLDQIERVMLAKLAPKLGRWHVRGAQERLAATWRHRVEWARVNPSVRGAAASPRWCLAHIPDPETGQPDPSTAALLEALRRAGQEPTLLRCEPGWTREDYRRALAEGMGVDAGPGARALPVDALLSTLALAEGEPTDGRPPSLETLERTTALLQGLIDLDAEALVPTLPRLWVLTRGAAGPHDLRAPEQAMLWGLGAVAGVEHVSLWGGCLDLPPALTDALDDPHALASALSLALASDESQLALRGGQVQAKRLVACPDHGRSGAQPAWSGTALITGGTGAIGGHTARWLAREGIQRLVLTSRRGPWAPGAAELEAELVALGPSVELVACDVADPEALGALLDRLRREGPPLR
ncbi:modular polyketide synthase, partial [Plesiocystis pacifica SIR-1]